MTYVDQAVSNEGGRIVIAGGAAVTLEGEIGMTGGWHVSQEIKACTLDLSEGVNRLVLTVKALLVPNIDYFVFTDAAVGEST